MKRSRFECIDLDIVKKLLRHLDNWNGEHNGGAGFL